MNKKKKIIPFVLIIMLIAATASGCNKKEETKEAKEIDPFSEDIFNTGGGVNIEYSGYSPFLTPEIVIPEGGLPDQYSLFTYSIDNEGFVANGDEILVKAEFESDNFWDYAWGERRDYNIESKEKEFIVEGQPSYVTSFSDIESTDLNSFLDSLKKNFSEKNTVYHENPKGDIVNSWGEMPYDIEIENELILSTPITLNPSSYVQIIPFKARIKSSWRESDMDYDMDIYGYYYVTDFAVDKNGKIEKGYYAGLCDTMYNSREGMLEDVSDNYEIVERTEMQEQSQEQIQTINAQ